MKRIVLLLCIVFVTKIINAQITQQGTVRQNQFALWDGDGVLKAGSLSDYFSNGGSLYISKNDKELHLDLNRMTFSNFGLAAYSTLDGGKLNTHHDSGTETHYTYSGITHTSYGGPEFSLYFDENNDPRDPNPDKLIRIPSLSGTIALTDGINTTNHVPFWDAGGVLRSNSGLVVKNNNVGIGTANPQAKLHIKNADNSVAAILAENSVGGQLQVKTSIGPHSKESYIINIKDQYDTSHSLTLNSDGPSGDYGLILQCAVDSHGPYMEINNYQANFRSSFGDDYNFNVEGVIQSRSINTGSITNTGHMFSKSINTETIKTSDRIHIGSNTTYDKANGYALSVEGKAITEEVKVQLSSEWSDFVFYDDYKLPTLKEVENHIAEKGHLKDIPSAKEVAEKGIFLGDMNAKLLQKIEELTLYTIAQEKEIENFKKYKVSQEESMKLLLDRLEKLEQAK